MPRMRESDYEKKEEILTAIAEKTYAAYMSKAQELIAKNIEKTTKELIRLTEFATIEDATKLSAIKHHLKLAGFEVERVDHSGKVDFVPLKISRGADE